MRYARYGKNGPMVSRLGFGVMRLPARKAGDWGSVNFTKSTAVIRHALEAGVNFLDTHHGYHHGLSEVAIGRALKGWKGHRVTIQTKTPMYAGHALAWYKQKLMECLEKCGVESIDYLFSHAMSMDAFKKHGKKFFKLTDWALARGYIRHRGFSSHDTPEHVKQFIDTGEFAAMLLSYNWRNPTMADTLAYAADRGMGVAVMNPVGGGMLAASTPQILRLLRGAKSSAEVGFRYALSTPGVTLALSGMNTFEQVDENARIAGRKTHMTPKQRKALHEKVKELQKESEALCTACGYCMPCPHGVDIPGNFTLYTQAKLLGLVAPARQRYAGLAKHPKGDKSAAACKRCGACLPKCPNHIPIMDQLGDTAAMLGS